MTNRYADGTYVEMTQLFEADASFKVDELLKLLQRQSRSIPLATIADVGCGSGGATSLLAERLTPNHPNLRVSGWDIAPEPKGSSMLNVTFVRGDFSSSSERVDLAVLFDVIEHVRSPQAFLERIADRSRYVALHIPLDDNLFILLRSKLGELRETNGHVSYFNVVSALNLITASNLDIVDFDFTKGFAQNQAKSASLKDRILYLLKAGSWKINPAITYSIFGGVSLMILARSPKFSDS